MAEAAATPPERAVLAHGDTRRGSGEVGRSDAEVIEDLFRGYERRLGRFLVQLVGDRALAEDLLQDTFHDALRHRTSLGAVESPEAWLFGIARHRALAALRRHRRLRGVLERLIPHTVLQQEDDFELIALRDLLARHLEPDDRALLILRYLHGFDAGELAAITGRSPEAVRQRLSRARKRLIAARQQSDADMPKEAHR